MNEVARSVVTVILGAGASRDVSYATGGEGCYRGNLGPSMPSPLDGDFFDLLQQLERRIEEGKAKQSMGHIIDLVLKWTGQPLWHSMERMFYNLHVTSVLDHKLYCPDQPDPARQLVNDFLRSIWTLLGEAHGTRVCVRHGFLLQELFAADAVLTFNYDFVAERALAQLFEKGRPPFGDWFYGLSQRPSDGPNDIPTLYKLHGSLNWKLSEDSTGETQNARGNWPGTWSEFAQELDYAREPDGYLPADEFSRPPILLPYWEKRVEKGLWLRIWKAAADQLRRTGTLVIWGYSLPTTDLKAEQLLALAFSRRESNLNKIVVIDPSVETKERWRRMFLGKPFFRFSSFDEFWNYILRQRATPRNWLTSPTV